MNNYDELMIIDSGYHLRGLFSYVLQVLSNLHIIDLENKFSLVDLHTTPYNDKIKGSNVWTYYFKQIPNTKKEDLHLFKKITRNVWFDNNLQILPILDQNVNIRCNELIKKYIIIKDHIIEKKNNFIKDILQTNNYFSIHYRGTDHIQDSEFVDKKYYYEQIEENINKFDKALICSDEQSFIDEVISYFGKEKIVSYPSFRSLKNDPIHFNNLGFEYKSGEDVLIESLLMADSKFLIRTISGVTLFSLIYNLNLKYKSLDEKFYERYREKYNIK